MVIEVDTNFDAGDKAWMNQALSLAKRAGDVILIEGRDDAMYLRFRVKRGNYGIQFRFEFKAFGSLCFRLQGGC